MPTYVKFEMPKDLADKTYEIIEAARESGKVRKGANEVTKLVERGQAKLIVMAVDVQPEEVLMHMPALCEEKGTPYAYVPSKSELGRAAGLQVGTSAVAVIDPGKAKPSMDELVAKIKEL